MAAGRSWLVIPRVYRTTHRPPAKLTSSLVWKSDTTHQVNAARSQLRLSAPSLSPAERFAGLRIHPHEFAFFNEKRHAHYEAGFQRRLFAGTTGCRVAAQPRLSRRDRELDILGQLQRNRR